MTMISLILARETILPEAYIAKWVEKNQQGFLFMGKCYCLLFSEADRASPRKLIQRFLDENKFEVHEIYDIVILGGYFKQEQLDEISGMAAQWPHGFIASVMLNNGDSEPALGSLIKHTRSVTKGEGPMHQLLDHYGMRNFALDKNNGPASTIIDLLSRFHYGPGDDDSFAFNYGLQRQVGEGTALNEILSITSVDRLPYYLSNGKQVRALFAPTIESRCKMAVKHTIGGLSVSCAFGDSPIIDTAQALACYCPSTVGILFRFDLSKKTTLLTVRSTGREEKTTQSPVNAAKILMCALINAKKSFDCMIEPDEDGFEEQEAIISGGGSDFFAGGSINKLLFPAEFADPPPQPSFELE